MLTTTTQARDFTENDWYGFAGAEPWSENEQPLTRDIENAVVVADKHGVSILFYFEGEDGEDLSFSRSMPLLDKPLARLIVNALPYNITPQQATELGFTQD